MPTVTDNFWVFLGALTGDTITEQKTVGGYSIASVEIELTSNSKIAETFQKEVLMIRHATSSGGQPDKTGATDFKATQKAYDLKKVSKNTIGVINGVLRNTTGDTAIQKKTRLMKFSEDLSVVSVVWGTVANGQQFRINTLILVSVVVSELGGAKYSENVSGETDTPSKTFAVDLTFEVITENLAE